MKEGKILEEVSEMDEVEMLEGERMTCWRAARPWAHAHSAAVAEAVVRLASARGDGMDAVVRPRR